MYKKITVYEKPTCTTCRNMSLLLRENGIEFDKINYFTEPFTTKSLGALLKKAKLRPYEALRHRETQVKELGLSETTPDNEVLQAIVDNPSILQRPIVESGDKAVMARPIEKVRELLKF
jgi:arsenate reductase